MSFPATQHTLPNGLTLYLSPNSAEPRIYTQIAVRAGSKHDPDQSTGLAHYLEHMLFKGTDKIGSSDWDAEEPLLQQIAQAYEDHRQTTSTDERRRLYTEIDTLSQRAAAYALPGEYDRIIAQLGARDTNAYTWVDQTVFLNDIPSNELERWMQLEAERFSRLVLRLFHTELETVFEEFNITQDSDGRKAMRVANEALFATHPYGTHTTIGKGEHLKAPSHFDIYDFFSRHYVPANMCIVLAGDFDEAEAFELARKTFGAWQPREVPAYAKTESAPVAAGDYEVFGEESESLQLNWRVPGAATRESLAAELSAGMLFNQQAGLFDLELNQRQQVLKASVGVTPMAEYGVLRASFRPRPGQSLDEARALGLAQIERLATGDYPDWLREAVLVDHELSDARTVESNPGRAALLSTAFLHRLDLHEALRRTAALRTISDAELQAFAKTYLAPAACVAVYKRQAPDPDVIKVEKPEITPIPLHTTGVSGFAERLLAQTPEPIAAEFADLDDLVTRLPIDELRGLEHLKNSDNALFELLYVFDFGTRDERWADVATDYLQLLGTAQHSPADLEIAIYRLGLAWQVNAAANRIYVGVSGLDKHLVEGLDLLDHLLAQAEPNADTWAKLVDDIAQKRRNERADKQLVLRKGLSHFGRYGSDSPQLTQPTTEELRRHDPAALIAWVHELPRRAHQVFYYGPRPAEELVRVLARRPSASPSTALPLPKAPALRMEVPATDRVLFLHFPQVQVEVLVLRHVTAGFQERLWVLSEWFNQYYGLGLSSVVFQELRESRALAYSTYAYAESPQLASGDHALQAFIGTQPDKLGVALEALRDLLANWRFDAAAAERVREGVLQQMRSGRDLRQSQYWLWRQAQDRGLTGNPRERMYESLLAATTDELRAFYDELSAAPTTYLVLGDRARVDQQLLVALGPVTELTMDQVMAG